MGRGSWLTRMIRGQIWLEYAGHRDRYSTWAITGRRWRPLTLARVLRGVIRRRRDERTLRKKTAAR